MPTNYEYRAGMQATYLLIAGALVLGSCTPLETPQAPKGGTQDLSPAGKALIGRKIWQNECGGTIDGLTTWNFGEAFPSFGIGHFIWYPAGVNGPFEESWPSFVRYARERGATPPALATSSDCPWPNKKAFHQEFRGPQLQQLRNWLASNVSLQTDFIIARSRAALPKMLAASPATSRGRVQANYQKVASTPQGTYALIDYVNFKGEGTAATEQYRGQGWGLLQVLQEMRPVAAGPAAATEFAEAAKRVLTRRVANSDPARGEARWLAGWHSRCDTYRKPL